MGEVVRPGDGLATATDDQTGQFTGRLDLTPKQAKFAEALADGLSPVDAGRQAGYAHPLVTSYKVRNSPALREKVFRLRESKIQRMSGLALSVVEKLLKDDKTPPGVRLEAAKHTLKLAGHEREAEKLSKDKPLAEMSLADLERLKAAHDALKVISSSQTIDQAPRQAIDIIEEDTP